MIIFLSDIKLLPFINYSKYDDTSIFNLSSYYSGYLDISDLIISLPFMKNYTDRNTMYEFMNSKDFDYLYANDIQNNANKFRCIMEIVHRSYEGELVIVLIYRDPFRDYITESIIKYIQQMYGHKCYILNDIEDIESIPSEERFTPLGLANYDADILRYTELQSKGMLQPLRVSYVNRE